MKVYIVCTCHPRCFIQHASPFNHIGEIHRFVIVIIFFVIPIFLSFLNFLFFYFIWIVSLVFNFVYFLWSSTSSAASSYSSPFCSCNLDRWSESSSCCSSSFQFDKNGMFDEIRSKPIQHKNCVGWAWKCWMKNLLAIKFSSNTIFLHLAWFFLFLLFLRSVKPMQHFIQNGIFVMLDEMLDRFNKALNESFWAFSDEIWVVLLIEGVW